MELCTINRTRVRMRGSPEPYQEKYCPSDLHKMKWGAPAGVLSEDSAKTVPPAGAASALSVVAERAPTHHQEVNCGECCVVQDFGPQLPATWCQAVPPSAVPGRLWLRHARNPAAPAFQTREKGISPIPGRRAPRRAGGKSCLGRIPKAC